MSNTSPSGPTRALADLAFGSRTHVLDTSRPLAWLSPEEMAIDLSDPVQRRFGDYELIEKIGQGGMGVVYRARQHGLDRDVALKLLAAGPWASDEFIERFRREAKSAARMQHPNIVEIYEFGHRDGLNYFSMRLIEGQSLAEKLQADGAMAPKDTARLLRTLAEAMDYAHRLGVLHLDLKPANVLLTKSGEPLIADFGLARRIDAGHEGGSEISGTPSYMAPEQAQLESHPLSASTDIYGLGAILYECLTGRPPFLASSAQDTLERVVMDAPKSPRTINKAIPADLEAICLKCLGKEPDKRYATARELAEDLRRFVEGEPVSVRRLNGFQRAARWARREPRLATLVGLLVMALVAGLLGKQLQQQANEDAEIERAMHAAEVMAMLYDADPIHPDKGMDAFAEVMKWASTTTGEFGAGNARTRRVQDAFLHSLARSGEPRKRAAARIAILWSLYSADQELTASRIDLLRQLRASGDLEGQWAAWMVEDGTSPDYPNQSKRLFAAVGQPGSEPETDRLIALTACRGFGEQPECAALRALPARLDPGNGFAWLFAAPDPARDRRAALEHLHRAAESSRFDDYNARLATAFAKRIRGAHFHLSERMARLQSQLFPGSAPVDLLLIVHLPSATPTPIDNLKDLCNPSKTPANESLPVADCLKLAALVANGRSSISTRRQWSDFVFRRLAPGSDQARAAEANRAIDLWLFSHRELASLNDLGNDAKAVDRYLQDLGEAGEWEAVQRQLDRTGIPRQPSEIFLRSPSTADRMLLPEQRTAR